MLKWVKKEAEDAKAEQQFWETSQRELLVSANAAADVIHQDIGERMKEWLVQQDIAEGFMDG